MVRLCKGKSMVIQQKPITVEAFNEFVARPENRERPFELIGGEIVEGVSNGVSSHFGILLGGMIAVWVKQHKLGHTTGADGGYMVVGEKYVPDAAYISNKRQPKKSREAYNPLAPDLALEVLSPSNTPTEMRIKVVNYLRAGTVVWVLDPELKQIEVYVPGQPPRVLGICDVLDGGDVLPGFRVVLSDLFDEVE